MSATLRRKNIEERLRPSRCVWPTGDPKADVDFDFCGATRKRGSPYCEEHDHASIRHDYAPGNRDGFVHNWKRGGKKK